MTPTVRINTAGMKAAFARFSAVDQKAIMDKTIRTDAMGFVRDVIAITPPGHQGKPLASGSKGEPAVQAGEAAIRRDLKRIFTALDDNIVSKALSMDNVVSDNVRLWVAKNGDVYGVERRLWRPHASIEAMYDHHRRYFKNGRMTQAGTFTRDIGRWKFIDKMVVPKSRFLEYQKYVFEKIGILAGGWAAAATALKVRVPKIAKRHASGSFLPIEGPDSLRLRLTNTNTYASDADVERRARWVLDSDKRKKRLAIRIKAEIRAKLKQQLALS